MHEGIKLARVSAEYGPAYSFQHPGVYMQKLKKQNAQKLLWIEFQFWTFESS